MKYPVYILFLLCMASCSKETIQTNDCNTEATIRDLTGLDGCGIVFELKDGTRLEPLRLLVCGTPPLPEEVTQDPLFNYNLDDGKKVKISYYQTKAPSICMAGPTVKITCIKDYASSETKN